VQIVALDFLAPPQVWNATHAPAELVAAVDTYDLVTEFVVVSVARRRWSAVLPSLAAVLCDTRCVIAWQRRKYSAEVPAVTVLRPSAPRSSHL
jgi:hypothetical protein